MSSSAPLPSPDDDYTAHTDSELTLEFWDAALNSIGQRLRLLEALKVEWETLIAEGTGQALAVIQANVAPQLATLTTAINQLKADVIVAQDAVATITSGFVTMANVIDLNSTLALKASTAYVDNAIAALKGGVADAYDTLADITTAIGTLVPSTRKLVGGAGITLNGGSEASLGGDITIAIEGVPTGAVIGFDLDAPPTGYIVGDGSAINRAAYPALDAKMYCGDANNATATAWYRCTNPANPTGSRSTTGAYIVTRDWRGLFPRFLDGGRGLDTGRVRGSYQADQNASHTHGVTDAGHSHGVNDPGHSHSVFDPHYASGGGNPGRQASAGNSDSTGTSASGTGISIKSATTGISVQSSGGTEARPKNGALLGCIKY